MDKASLYVRVSELVAQFDADGMESQYPDTWRKVVTEIIEECRSEFEVTNG